MCLCAGIHFHWNFLAFIIWMRKKLTPLCACCGVALLFVITASIFRGKCRHSRAEFAAFLGITHCVATNSGTGALHTALAALGVGPGQEVIVPAYLWVSVVAAVVNLGAIPVLADIDETFCMNAVSLESKITPRTSGVIFVHMSGAPAT